MPNRKKNINEILNYQELIYIHKIIKTKLFSKFYNHFLINYIIIDKTYKLINWKYL